MSSFFKKSPDFPKTKAPALKVGKRYKFVPLKGDGKEKNSQATTKAGETKTGPFKATVEKDYKRWYLLMTTAGYHTTMLKSELGLNWEAKKA